MSILWLLIKMLHYPMNGTYLNFRLRLERFMEEIRFKPTIFVLIAIIGAVAIAATGFLSTDWMLTTAVSVVLFLLSYVWFFSVRKRIDEILTHDLDKIANDAARAIREELESSSQGGGDRSSHEKDKNLELKEKELLTKEKELALREKEISSREKEIQKNKDDLDSKKKSFEQASSILLRHHLDQKMQQPKKNYYKEKLLHSGINYYIWKKLTIQDCLLCNMNFNLKMFKRKKIWSFGNQALRA